MGSSKTLLFIVGVLFLGSIGYSQNVFASSVCDGTIKNTIVEDNLIVPNGSTCTLENVTINGDVTVGKESILISDHWNNIFNGDIQSRNSFEIHIQSSTINGNISIFKINDFFISSSLINGNLSVLKGVDIFSHIIISNNTVDGDVKIIGNAASLIPIVVNNITGNLIVVDNHANSGIGFVGNEVGGRFMVINNTSLSSNITQIQGNVIGNTAICKNNNPEVGDDLGMINIYNGKNKGCP